MLGNIADHSAYIMAIHHGRNVDQILKHSKKQQIYGGGWKSLATMTRTSLTQHSWYHRRIRPQWCCWCETIRAEALCDDERDIQRETMATMIMMMMRMMIMMPVTVVCQPFHPSFHQTIKLAFIKHNSGNMTFMQPMRLCTAAIRRSADKVLPNGLEDCLMSTSEMAWETNHGMAMRHSC